MSICARSHPRQHVYTKKRTTEGTENRTLVSCRQQSFVRVVKFLFLLLIDTEGTQLVVSPTSFKTVTSL